MVLCLHHNPCYGFHLQDITLLCVSQVLKQMLTATRHVTALLAVSAWINALVYVYTTQSVCMPPRADLVWIDERLEAMLW